MHALQVHSTPLSIVNHKKKQCIMQKCHKQRSNATLKTQQKQMLAKPLQEFHTSLRLTSIQNCFVFPTKNQQTKKNGDSKENQTLVVTNIFLPDLRLRQRFTQKQLPGESCQHPVVNSCTQTVCRRSTSTETVETVELSSAWFPYKPQELVKSLLIINCTNFESLTDKL